MNVYQIINCKYPNEIKEGLITLENNTGEDDGWYISGWNVPEVDQPSSEEIESWQAEASVIQFKNDATTIIEQKIEQIAKERGYDNSLSCASYATSTVEGWKAEADAFIAWRDSVWSWAISQFEEVSSGQTEVPTLEEVEQSIPSMVWPT